MARIRIKVPVSRLVDGCKSINWLEVHHLDLSRSVSLDLRPKEVPKHKLTILPLHLGGQAQECNTTKLIHSSWTGVVACAQSSFEV